ncbi:MAG: hypothetical protein ACRDMH_18230 [Solirubrobacterales bacterium]
MPRIALAAPGDLDPSFGNGGKVITDFGGDAQGEILSAAIDSQDRIVTAGFSAGLSPPWNFTLARYRPDGNLDPSFGDGGIATTDLQGTAFSVTTDRHGRIVAAGATQSASGDLDFVVARYHSDGSPDRPFGSDGKVITDLGGQDWVRYVGVDSRGRILAVGQRGVTRGWFALARYLPSGTLDESFSGDGKAIFGFRGVASRVWAASGAIDSRNRIYAAGTADTRSGDDFALVRFSVNGVVTARSFGTGGMVLTDFGGHDYGSGTLIDPQGRVVLSGDSDGDFALARYQADGSLDRGFGGDGKVTTDVGGYGDADDVAIDSQGRVVAGGYESTGGEYDNRSAFAVARYNPNGSPDSAFGSSGVATTDFGAETLDEAFSVAVDSQDRIVAAGYRSGAYALARYLGQ